VFKIVAVSPAERRSGFGARQKRDRPGVSDNAGRGEPGP